MQKMVMTCSSIFYKEGKSIREIAEQIRIEFPVEVSKFSIHRLIKRYNWCVKNGCQKNGKQKFMCKDCGRSFTWKGEKNKHPEKVREQALKMLGEDMSISAGNFFKSYGRNYALLRGTTQMGMRFTKRIFLEIN